MISKILSFYKEFDWVFILLFIAMIGFCIYGFLTSFDNVIVALLFIAFGLFVAWGWVLPMVFFTSLDKMSNKSYIISWLGLIVVVCLLMILENYFHNFGWYCKFINILKNMEYNG